MRNTILKIITIGVVLIFCIATFIKSFQLFLETPLVPPDQTLDYVFKPGSSIKTLSFDLKKLGLLSTPQYLIILAYWKGDYKNLQAGEYLFQAGTTPLQLLNQLSQGKVYYHRFTINEGWTVKQLIEQLNKNPLLIHKLTNVAPEQLLTSLGLPPRCAEGLFFPATYDFVRGSTDIDILQKAYQTMADIVNKEWENRDMSIPYQNSYQALIAASLISKETAQPQEYVEIAGVIANRLQKNMRLQFDSTVIYGLGTRYTGDLTKMCLQDVDPYNTYVINGLPPTPIGFTSQNILHAVLHPAHDNMLYFVAKGNGTHQFSETLEQQNLAVNDYQLQLVYPKIGKRENVKVCKDLWYFSSSLQQLFPDHC